MPRAAPTICGPIHRVGRSTSTCVGWSLCGQQHEARLSQKDFAERLGRSPSAVWHCLRRLGLA
jgi:hypothetical protein